MLHSIPKPQILSIITQQGFAPTLILAGIIGIAAAIGAVIFRDMLGFFHNLFFLGNFSIPFDPLNFTLFDPWGIFIIIVPPVFGLGVVYLVKNYAPEAKGHGVPEVLDAVYNKGGYIRPRISFIKALASSITIGSGGSVGREGPIIQIGAAIGSFFGQRLNLEEWQRMTLVAAGAGAGIAATFNTPIGGILFATELILPEISMRTVAPVIFATTMSTFLARLLIGTNIAFSIPAAENLMSITFDTSYWIYLCSLGIIVGILAFIFSRSIYWFEDLFDQMISNQYVRHALGMLGVGCIIWLVRDHTGFYYVEGVGYATIQSILTNTSYSLSMLAGLLILKIMATGLTLGSGGSGGIFSPSLFIGAIFGCFVGTIVQTSYPGFPLTPALFAVISMAGMIAGTTHAMVTAIIMMIEMTGAYNVVLEIICVSVMSASTSFMISSSSIYTLKLIRRGDYVPLMRSAQKPLE